MSDLLRILDILLTFYSANVSENTTHFRLNRTSKMCESQGIWCKCTLHEHRSYAGTLYREMSLPSLHLLALMLQSPRYLQPFFLGLHQQCQERGNDFIVAMNKMKVSVITHRPSALNINSPEELPSLRKAVKASEACILNTAIKWTSVANIRFFNGYGPTKTMACVAVYEYNVLPQYNIRGC